MKNVTLKKTSVALTLSAISLAGMIVICGNTSPANAQKPRGSQRKLNRYACPMHPEVTSTRPRKCPKCGMALRLVKDEPATSSAVKPPVATVSNPPAEGSAISAARIPDVAVYDQNGKQWKFRSDLITGKTVAINFIFTTCTTICPPLTATFRRVQQELESQKLPVHLISISVDPATDTPERLHDFAAKFKAGPGWTFVTGDTAAIDSILQSLGTAVANKNDHTPMILVGNEVSGYWTRAYGLSSPTSLMKVISTAAASK